MGYLVLKIGYLWIAVHTGIELSWHLQHQMLRNCLLLNTAVPTESMTMVFVERDECISIFSLSIFFFISFLGFHVQSSCHLDVFS